jgi:hypothetical protein
VEEKLRRAMRSSSSEPGETLGYTLPPCFKP